jgi:hypothetical protein
MHGQGHSSSSDHPNSYCLVKSGTYEVKENRKMFPSVNKQVTSFTHIRLILFTISKRTVPNSVDDIQRIVIIKNNLRIFCCKSIKVLLYLLSSHNNHEQLNLYLNSSTNLSLDIVIIITTKIFITCQMSPESEVFVTRKIYL